MDLYIVAGPNGSGKSTFINDFIEIFNKKYILINADSIAHEKFGYIKDEKEKYKKAFSYAEELMNKAFNEKKDILIETVNSSTHNDDFYKKCKDAGYLIHFFYIATDDPNINIARVCGRVSEGGHNVPEEKVRERYYNSLDRILYSWNIADTMYLYDNSQSELRLCVYAVKADNYLVKMIPHWVRKYFIDKVDI